MSYHNNRFLIQLAGYRHWDMLTLDVYDLEPELAKSVYHVTKIPWKTAQYLLDHFNFVSATVANCPVPNMEFHLRQSLANEEINFSFNEILTNDPMLCAVVVECAKWIML